MDAIVGTDPYRVISLMVLPDTTPFYEQCVSLGFAPVDVSVPGCRVLRAGDSYLALATLDSMMETYSAELTISLVGHATPYVYVPALDAAKDRLGKEARVLAEGMTVRGTREALVDIGGQRVILAQQMYRSE